MLGCVKEENITLMITFLLIKQNQLLHSLYTKIPLWNFWFLKVLKELKVYSKITIHTFLKDNSWNKRQFSTCFVPSATLATGGGVSQWSKQNTSPSCSRVHPHGKERVIEERKSKLRSFRFGRARKKRKMWCHKGTLHGWSHGCFLGRAAFELNYEWKTGIRRAREQTGPDTGDEFGKFRES